MICVTTEGSSSAPARLEPTEAGESGCGSGPKQGEEPGEKQASCWLIPLVP